MKANKESALSTLNRWMPTKLSRKIAFPIYLTIHIVATFCLLTGLLLGYRLWQVGFNNAAIMLIPLVLCFSAAFTLLFFRHSIKDQLLELLVKRQAKTGVQVAKRLADKGLNKSREWVVNGIQDGIETAQDILEDGLAQGRNWAKSSAESTRKTLFPQGEAPEERPALASPTVTTAFKPATLCPACGRPQRAGARFCDGCGKPLPYYCPNCGTLLRARAKFCDHCGQAL